MSAGGLESVEVLAAVADFVIDPVMLFGAVRDTAGQVVDFRFEYANTAFCSYLGVPRSELMGRLHSEVAAASADQELYCRVLETGEPARGRSRYVGGALGRAVDLEVVVAVARFGDGVIVSARDPRDLQGVEISIPAEGRFAKLIENSSDIVIATDAEGVMSYLSAAITSNLGYEPDELIGTSFLTLVHPDDVERAAGGMALVASSAGPSRSDPIRVRTATGGWIWVEAVTNNLLGDPEVASVVVNVRDVTASVLAKRALAVTHRALRAMTDIDAAILRATNEAELLQDTCQVLVEIGGYRFAAVVSQDPNDVSQKSERAVFGDGAEYRARVRAARKAGLIKGAPLDVAMATGALQIVSDYACLPVSDPRREIALEHGYLSAVFVPVLVGGDVAYLLAVHAGKADVFDDEVMALFEQLARNVAQGILALRLREGRDHTLEQLARNNTAMLETIAAVTEARDPYTSGHQIRVAQLSVAIAEELGLEPDLVAGIRAGASIHDLGKISIPSEILTKPARLTALEYEMVKMHPEVGYDIVKGIEFPWPVADMIWEHHERLDGSGYPRGLHGDQIAIASRIIAIADVVDSMASHRPYRPALGIDAALAEIEGGHNGLYDTFAADACRRVCRDGDGDGWFTAVPAQEQSV